MGIKRPKGYGLVSRVPGGDLNDYISAFTFGNEDVVYFGQNRTQESILTRRIRTTEDNGQDLGIEGGRGLGTDKDGGDLNLYLGKSTGNASPGSLVIYSGGSGSSGETLNNGKTEVFRVDPNGTISSTGSIDISGNLEANNIEVDQINLGHPSDTTLTRTSSGIVAIEGSQILTGQINLTSQVTGNLPLTNGGTGASTVNGAKINLQLDNVPNVDCTNANNITSGTLQLTRGGTGATTAAGARTNLGVDAAGTDNSTDVTLAGNDYITISDQEITANDIDLTDDVTGTLPVTNGGTGVTSLSELYSYQYLTWEVNTNSFSGTNYELPAANGGFGSDIYTTNSGVARNTAIDGSVTISLAANNQQQGWYVPHACELVGVSGMFRNNGAEVNPRDVAVFVGTPDIGTANSSTYRQRAFAAGDDDGGQSNSKPYTTNVTLATPFSLTAGEVVMPAVCNSTGSSTVSMQGNFSIIIRTALTT